MFAEEPEDISESSAFAGFVSVQWLTKASFRASQNLVGKIKE